MTKKAIGLTEFNELSETIQFELLHRDGVFVGKRKVGNQVVVLFQLYGFYIEVYYKKYRKKIDRINSSNHTDILQPYLDQIKVRDLKDQKGKE
jgi:hypothetical protein